MRRILPSLFTLFILAQCAFGLPSCQDVSSNLNSSKNVYDFIIVGGGPGGGPLAARLAESGYSGRMPHNPIKRDSDRRRCSASR